MRLKIRKKFLSGKFIFFTFLEIDRISNENVRGIYFHFIIDFHVLLRSTKNGAIGNIRLFCKMKLKLFNLV